MLIKRGVPEANTCRVSIEVSWETAQALAELLPQLTTALQRLTDDRHAYTIAREVTFEERAEQLRQRRKELFGLARMASSELRRRLREDTTFQLSRAAVVADMAARMDITHRHLEALLAHHKKRARVRLHRVRNARIVRLYSEGVRNVDIARQVGLAPASVSKIVGKHRRQVAERRRERMQIVAGLDVPGGSR